MKKVHSPRKEIIIRDILRATGGRLLQGDPETGMGRVSTDTRSLKRGDLFIAIKGRNFDGHQFIKAALKKSAAGIIICRKVKAAFPANLTVIQVKDTVKALGKIARLHRQRFKIPVIAVTGSNGKTTTKDMVAAILQRKFRVLKSVGTQNNHIGLPLTLLKMNRKHQAAVLELGTNHPGEISYLAGIALPTAAVITNIGISHTQFLKNISGVFREKKSLLDALHSNGAAILNNDDLFLRRIKNKPYKIITFGIRHKSDFCAEDIHKENGALGFTINGREKLVIRTPARLNIYNCLAAVSCARLLGVKFQDIRAALSKFRLPAGRMEIKKCKGWEVIDDTYNANPVSFECALEVLSGYNSSHRKIAVCADMKELGRQSGFLHYALGGRIAGLPIDRLISVGRLGRRISAGAKKAGMPAEKIFHAESVSQASRLLSGMLRPGDVVLMKGSRAMGMETIVNHLMRT